MSKFEGAWRRWSGRKQAHWVWDTRGAPLGDGMWVCSNCRRGNRNIPAYPDVNPSEFYGSWFCPNCGRPMCDKASFKQYSEYRNYQVFVHQNR